MQFKIFSTDKPRRFSFHTRYHNQKKLSRDAEGSVQKGSFQKFRNRYDTDLTAIQDDAKKRRRRLLMSILVVSGIIYLILRASNSVERILSLLLQ
jgi:hypothetical protein